jgi:hypothetical protein
MRTSILLSIALFASFAAMPQQTPADVPDSLKPPATEHMILQAHATGAQVYTCTASADGKFAWTLKGPDAELRDASGKVIIEHSAGPTWQHNDGSKITGKVVAKQNSPDAGSVPWLLLAADNSRSGEGVLSKVTSIQRIHTEGGQPPATGCDESSKGAEKRSNYSADYVFYAPAH